MRLSAVRLTALLALAAAPASADTRCPIDIDPAGDFVRGRVRDDTPELHFLRPAGDGRAECPAATPACTLPGYLVAGDEILIDHIPETTILCVHFVSRNGVATDGLVDEAKLKLIGNIMEPMSAPAALGTWIQRGATITIAAGEAAGELLVTGNASRGPPGYNVGRIEGRASIGDGAAGYEEGHYRGDAPARSAPPLAEGCRVRLRTTGTYLLVDDNNGCGGQGVSFTGIYVKAPAATAPAPKRGRTGR